MISVILLLVLSVFLFAWLTGRDYLARVTAGVAVLLWGVGCLGIGMLFSLEWFDGGLMNPLYLNLLPISLFTLGLCLLLGGAGLLTGYSRAGRFTFPLLVILSSAQFLAIARMLTRLPALPYLALSVAQAAAPLLVAVYLRRKRN